MSIDLVKALLTAYVELNTLQARRPGECSHMLAQSIQFIEKRLREILKGSTNV
jgi:hypothetical protein